MADDKKQPRLADPDRWVVQGHYKTLKDGRRVWVRGYVRGPVPTDEEVGK